MLVTLKGLSKSGKVAVYTGLPVALRVSTSAFVDKKPLASFELVGEFAQKSVKAPKIVETKEERKARLAALPKLTLAEKIAKREAALEAMRAKLAREQGQTVNA